MNINRYIIFAIAIFATLNADAAVVQRPGVTSRTSASRVSAVSKNTTTTPTTIVSETTTSGNTSESTHDFDIKNKSVKFESLLQKLRLQYDTSDDDLARRYDEARNKYNNATSNDNNGGTDTIFPSTCDTTLRKCMAEKCGENFTGCARDTDTLFGTKLDACRKNTNCTANEFRAYSAEIKADRTNNIKFNSFTSIRDCGVEYNACIAETCGTSYSLCIGTTSGNDAITKCSNIANRCKAMDSGLASRTLDVFAQLRQGAEQQIPIDEKTLYNLREQMESACSGSGAMFDERTFRCVYTVNFHAGENNTVYASKKLFAGDSFDCTPDWFGVDVTTYKENAYREIREESRASAALMGAGLGIGLGSVTSGAVTNAVNSRNAVNARDKLECEQHGGTWNALLGTCKQTTE